MTRLGDTQRNLENLGEVTRQKLDDFAAVNISGILEKIGFALLSLQRFLW